MKIYYINLDRSFERRQWMERQLSNLVSKGIHYERIPAIDGSSLTNDEISSVYEKLGINTKNSTKLTPNDVGCFLSHRNAWKLIGSNEDDYGVILEDDILLSSFSEFFLSNTNWIPPKAGFIRLETTNKYSIINLTGTSNERINGKNFTFFQFNQLFQPGSGAYLVHNEFALFLLQKYKKFNSAVDGVLNCTNFEALEAFKNLQNKLRFQIKPTIAIQQYHSLNHFLPKGAEGSNIDQERNDKQLQIRNKGIEVNTRKIAREFSRVFSSYRLERQFQKITGKRKKFEFLE